MIKNRSILAFARSDQNTILFYHGLPPDDLPPHRYSRPPSSPSVGRLNGAVYDALQQHTDHTDLSPSLLGLGWVMVERGAGKAKATTTE